MAFVISIESLPIYVACSGSRTPAASGFRNVWELCFNQLAEGFKCPASVQFAWGGTRERAAGPTVVPPRIFDFVLVIVLMHSCGNAMGGPLPLNEDHGPYPEDSQTS